MMVIETALEDSGGKPDENARRKIGNLLEGTVRAVQEPNSFDTPVSNGIAIRDLSIDTGSIARLSFMDRQAVGVIETRLWDAASELRSNSKLKSSEYYVPVRKLLKDVKLLVSGVTSTRDANLTLKQAHSFRKPRTRVA
jgi:hypothetical protein